MDNQIAKLAGGCQCGRVRFVADVDNFEAYLCHCRMCQRASGNVSIAFKNLRKDAVQWLVQPDWYASSPIARRPFCSHCGTPLGFEYYDSEFMDLTIGAFDEPAPFFPTENFGIESRHAAWSDTSHLPGARTEDSESITRRWQQAENQKPDD